MSISLFRSIAAQYEHLRRINTVPMMNIIIRQIEDQILQHQLSVDFFAGFQRFSHFPEQHRRYSRLGGICRRVHLFGVPDYQPPPVAGVEYIALSPNSALTQEWFLLVDTSEFWATLVAKEAEGKDPITGGHRFDGIWSFDEVVVDRISLLISQEMEMPYQPVQQRNYSRQNAHISEICNRMLGTLEQSELNNQRRRMQLHTLQNIAEICSRNPLELLQDAAQIFQTAFGATGVIIVLQTANERCTVAAVEGEANGRGWKIPLSQGLSGQTIQQRRLIHIADLSRKLEGEPLLPTARTLISAPMFNRRIHGAITIGNAEPNRWTEEDAQTVMTAARMLAIQLERALSHNKNSTTATGPITGIRN
ncbi:GAF domain-containing protein [Kovacikia minuta CCNUW1]|uniref:DICT sensory domain-containing protein n=1 Tax=Kovacikia minuta TaxID=2931930 RepID=UPI001CCCB959|nr:DICT sensory domain-containing protein [Kovacikia minuta]UBF25152.1 GAF domain-containing protein [Kovacikia minuta CCNUW1]